MRFFSEAMLSLNPDLVWKCEGNDPTNETEFNSRVSIQTDKDNSLVVFGEINGTVVWEDISNEIGRLQTEYDTNQPLKLLREERDKKLKEEVDSKTCEAYNNGTQLSTEWKNYRQALLDMTLQTPTLDENGILKAGLELDEIYWPIKPE